MVTIRNIKNGRIWKNLPNDTADLILRSNKEWSVMPIEGILDIVKSVKESEQIESKSAESNKSKKSKVNNETTDVTTV